MVFKKNNSILELFFLIAILVVMQPVCSLAQSEQEKVKTQAPPKKMSWVAHILRQKEKEQIPEIQVKPEVLPVYLVPHKDDLRPLVEVIFVTTNDKNDYFTAGDRPIKKRAPNEYSVFAFLNSQISELLIVSRNRDSGEKKEEIVYIFAPESQEFQVVSPWSALSASAGLAFLTYDQSLYGVLQMRSAVVSLQYLSPETNSRWGIASQIDLTVATYSSKPIDVNPQLIQGEMLASYRLRVNEASRWRHSLLLGMNYLSLESNGSQFGFSALISPSIGWKSKQYLTTTSSLIYEARINTYEDFSLFTRRGAQVSATWSQQLKSLRRRDVSIGYMSSKFQSNQRDVSVDFLTFKLGFSI
jgi:hypothetical protein